MVPKGPVRLHSRKSSSSALILRDSLSRRGPIEEIHINTSSNGAPSEVIGSQQDLLTVHVPRIDGMGVGFALGVAVGLGCIFLCESRVDINRMRTVDVSIERIGSVRSVNGGIEHVVELERVHTLPQARDIVALRQLRSKLQKLVFEDYLGVLGGEEDVAGGAPGNFEPEGGLVMPVELEVAEFVIFIPLCLRSHKKIIRDNEM